MDTPSPAALMYDIVQKQDEIDRLCARLTNGRVVFADTSLEKPKLKPAELGVLRAVSWFYVLYNEAGKVNVRFLSDRLHVYELDPDGQLSNHLTLVDRLRTYFQHNLDPAKPRDRDIQEFCVRWFTEQCGTSEPNGEDHWLACLRGFLMEALAFVDALSKCIREIERDESREQILQDWEFRRSRYHPPHEFDALIFKVATDMGRSTLDVVRFRKRFYDKWTQELSTLQGDYSFEIEARKLIEYTLLNETLSVLPITGQDIIDAFDEVEPGPKVGKLLEAAKALYEAEPCSREELLEKLQPLVEP
jgi:hypothetical protein